MKKYLSRKYILALLSLISTTGLVYFGAIDDGVYASVVIATVAAYITGNVFEARIDDSQ